MQGGREQVRLCVFYDMAQKGDAAVDVPQQAGRLNGGAEAAGIQAGSPVWMLVRRVVLVFMQKVLNVMLVLLVIRR